MKRDEQETRGLVERIRKGQGEAFEDLFGRHRNRLRRLVAVRMDDRLSARVDASDIVQETYLEAARRFPSYLEKPELTFFLWLRWIARDKIIQQYRQHVEAGKRALDREIPLVSRDSSVGFARKLVSQRATPTQEMALSEMAELLERSLQRLDEDERKMILWRSFEQLSVEETAELLGITRAAAGKRYLRALEKLRTRLKESGFFGGPAANQR